MEDLSLILVLRKKATLRFQIRIRDRLEEEISQASYRSLRRLNSQCRMNLQSQLWTVSNKSSWWKRITAQKIKETKLQMISETKWKDRVLRLQRLVVWSPLLLLLLSNLLSNKIGEISIKASLLPQLTSNQSQSCPNLLIRPPNPHWKPVLPPRTTQASKPNNSVCPPKSRLLL